jgi:hypothetical protein
LARSEGGARAHEGRGGGRASAACDGGAGPRGPGGEPDHTTGGKPITEPRLWYESSGCGYAPPDDDYVQVILEQNLAGEQCAIDTYDSLLKLVVNKDVVTYNMVMTILEQEVEHEEDLQSLLEDLELLVSRGTK